MLTELIATWLPLAASDDAGFLSSLLDQTMMWGRVALGIGLVIFVHELGHFVAAKTFGVKCEKFYVGFDVPLRLGPIKFPRTLCKFQYGETEYGIGILPLGGYVKMLGQDDDPRKLEEEARRIEMEGGDKDEPPELDPRSYPAKPVWQRMIIISAGVVVNVITGVMFAAIAYGYGVAYNPAVIGGVPAGGPAWQAGIQPGGQVIAVGDFAKEQMHFRDMQETIFMRGFDEPDQPIDVSIRYDQGVSEYNLLTAQNPEDKDVRMIGITNPRSTELSGKFPALEGTIAAKVLGDADKSAKIVAFDGTPIEQNTILSSTPFLNHLYTHPNDPIDLQLERIDGSTHEVQLPPQKAKSFGLRFQVGPVVALVENGPAEKAGVQIGDVIVAVADHDDVDALGLPLLLTEIHAETTLTVRRGSGDQSETVEIPITPVPMTHVMSPMSGLSGEIALNSLGLAYLPKTNVANLHGAMEADDQLQVNDEIKEVKLPWSESDIPENLTDQRYEAVLKQMMEGWEFANKTPLYALADAVQILPVDTELVILAQRPSTGRTITAKVKVFEDDRNRFDRGLMLTPSQSMETATSFGQAMSLGFVEGKRRFFGVIRFLGLMSQGKVKLRHVGGPLAIVDIAKRESEAGISRLLMFLTMLSMNLAILNFLPIPALDGGHMAFLLYELVMGKRANEQIEFRLTLAGVIALLTLMVVVFANDLMRYLQ